MSANALVFATNGSGGGDTKAAAGTAMRDACKSSSHVEGTRRVGIALGSHCKACVARACQAVRALLLRGGGLKHRPKPRRVQGSSALPMVCNLQLVLKLHIVFTARRCGVARGEQLEQANIKPPVRDSWSTSRSPTPALENTSEVTRASVRS